MWVSILVRHGDGYIGFCHEATSEMGQGSTNAESNLASLQILRGSGTDTALLWAPIILSLPALGDTVGLGCVNRSAGQSQALKACFTHRPGVDREQREGETAGARRKCRTRRQGTRHARELRNFIIHTANYCKPAECQPAKEAKARETGLV